ncbi:GLE1-like protein-domain-containing protein [Flagelloscypha sp. PMI_526]|nr:GLE1-like protein-domain-containing protein [Flagelloscypha sp. PMI_526]
MKSRSASLPKLIKPFNGVGSSIRTHNEYQDSYELWKRDLRTSVYRDTRRAYIRKTQTHAQHERERQAGLAKQQLQTLHAQQLGEIDRYQRAFQKQESQLNALDQAVTAKAQRRWTAIEAVISAEQEKTRRKLEAERKIREEEERKRKAEEDRKRAEEEKKRAEDEKKRAAAQKQKDDDERAAKEAADAARQVEEAKAKVIADKKAKADAVAAEAQKQKDLGLRSAEEDWQTARQTLLDLKTNSTRPVKADKAAKSTWGALRRQITPKVGQVTPDLSSINTTSMQILQILMPTNVPPHHAPIRQAVLSSLSKAVLLQAETEVVSEKKAAVPLAHVTFNLLTVQTQGLGTEFADILYSKLVQRVGIWAIPIPLPKADFDGRAWKNDDEKLDMTGYRFDREEREGAREYMERVAGVMRVYFEICKRREREVEKRFCVDRVWIWIARLVGRPVLLGQAVAAELLFTVLDVFGKDGLRIWGKQWIKMLALIYDGATKGYAGEGEDKKLIGGMSTEGKPARGRLQMVIESIMEGIQN